MKEIPLTQGKVAIVDDEDFDELMKVRWRFSGGYARRTRTIAFRKQVSSLMHREILGVTDSNIKVDHIDGNTLDNRKSNLRICTDCQNKCNRPEQKNNASGYKGVSKMRNARWRAEISYQGKCRYLGVFMSPEEAHAAYAAAAREIHGEFANIGSRGHVE